MFMDIIDIEDDEEFIEEFKILIEEHMVESDIYDHNGILELLDDGLITPEEAGFMQGFIDAHEKPKPPLY